jgi:hypothetical protein
MRHQNKTAHKFPSINATDTHLNMCVNHFVIMLYSDLLFPRNLIPYDRIIVHEIIF